MGFFFDWDSGDIGYSFSDTFGIDSEGNFKMKFSKHTAIDLNTGGINFISGWDDDEED